LTYCSRLSRWNGPDCGWSIGWETADQNSLDALAARLEDQGVAVEHGGRVLADERKGRGLIRVADPLVNRLEAFWGAETTTEPILLTLMASGALNAGTMPRSMRPAETSSIRSELTRSVTMIRTFG